MIPERSVIGRLRVRAAGRDRLQTSLRAGALLERLDLSPPGLSRSSILLIRTLHDPLPGCVSFARPAETAPARWQQAVTANIARITREAERPGRGSVSTGAAAVLFADEAELVACLVRDWLGGRVADRWWWRSVLGDLSARQWLRRHVLARGEVMVPAIAVLAAGRDAVAWLGRLEDAEAGEAIAAVARSHAVSLDAVEGNSAVRRPRARKGRDRPMDIESDRSAGSRSAALERLIATVPEVLRPALRPPQRRLLALVLALTRAPSWARTPRLACALQELDRRGPAAGAYPPAIPEGIGAEVPGPRARRAAAMTGALQTGDTPEQRAGSPNATADLGASPPRPRASGAMAQRRANDAFVHTHEAQQDAPPLAPRTLVGAPTARADATPAAPVPTAEPREVPAIEHAARLCTRFGGIFYLLNAALAMRLYSDFTAPRGANLKLSPWDWLALVGREWFSREFVGDPVWKLLAGLAGRKRRSLRRPRWLKERIEKLLARLALALGQEESADIPTFVCRYPAEVAVTASRVDVHLALSDLPLELRIAGLDRDPGWIPAAGRSIALHFE